MICNYKPHISTYPKPRTYQGQATLETVNAGMPYYVASPKYGYAGMHIPIAGSVSKLTDINKLTGEYNSDRTSSTEWVTCTTSRHQFDKPFKRRSLSDDGVLYQTYSPRMAFLNIYAALCYAQTGQVIVID